MSVASEEDARLVLAEWPEARIRKIGLAGRRVVNSNRPTLDRRDEQTPVAVKDSIARINALNRI